MKFNFERMRIASMRKKALGPSGSSGGFGGTGLNGGGGGSGFGGGGAGGRNTHNRFNPVYDDLSEGTIIEQFMPVDPRRLHRIWRRIRLQDPVAAPAIDLYSELPWSEFQIIGLEDRKIAHLYEDALNSINITSILPDLTGEYLSMGKIIGHLIMDESKGYWERCIIHDPDWIRVTPQPIPGLSPLLDIIPTPEMRRWANSDDERVLDSQREIDDLVQMIRHGQEIPLPMDNTFYLPRRTAPYDVIGASIFTRIIMFVAYEKALVNATIAASRRRASRIRHIQAGIDDVWEPSREELDDISDLFMQADEDPVGAIVVTRTGVTSTEVGGSSPSDIVKISDEWQFLLQGKLNALGVSEAFISGDANFNTMEQLMSVFLEKIKAHRAFFVNELILKSILKPLAKKHGFYHRKTADLAHRVRTGNKADDQKLIMPTIAWDKSLRPVADRDYLEILQMMEEKGIPITKRTWSSAAGFDLDSEVEQFPDDVEATRQLANQKKKINAISPPEEGMGMGGDMGMGGMGGDMGLGGLGGMDMGGMGGMDMGGMDMGGMGGDMGGGMGADAGMPGAAGGGGLELPAVGASASVRVGSYSADQQFLVRLSSLPVWGKKQEFMGVRFDTAELATRRLLDHLGSQISKNVTKAQARKILNTGHHRKDQVLRYLLSRIGIIRNADITRATAMDIQNYLQKTLGSKPQLLAVELRQVAACVQENARNEAFESAPRVASSVDRAQYWSKPTNEVSGLSSQIRSEKRNAGRTLLTGAVSDKSLLIHNEEE